MKKKVLYLISTVDEFELPLAVARSVKELMTMTAAGGRKMSNICSRMNRDKTRQHFTSGVKFERIELSDDENDI